MSVSIPNNDNYIEKTTFLNFGEAEYKVHLLSSTKHCKFSWSLTVEMGPNIKKEIHVNASIHAHICRQYKRIAPRQLYNIVLDALFTKEEFMDYDYYYTDRNITYEDNLELISSAQLEKKNPNSSNDYLVLILILKSKYEDPKKFYLIMNPVETMDDVSDQAVIILERRVSSLEDENAALKATMEIQNHQIMELQEDVRMLHQNLQILAEKQISKNRLSYKEWNAIQKELKAQKKNSQNIIHHAEALTGSVRNIAPKQMHSIYNQFKKLLHVSKPKKSQSQIQSTIQSYLKIFQAHEKEDRLVSSLCVAWLTAVGLKKPKTAKKLFSEIINDGDNRNLAFVYFSRGRLQQDPQKELYDYNQCLENNPTFFASYLNRANLYQYKLNQPKKALADYTMAIQYDPNDFSVYYNRAGLYFKHLNEPIKALADYNLAINLNPTYAHAYNNRALLYKTKLNDPMNALKSYDLAIKYDPEYFALYLNRASLKIEKLQNAEEALVDYNTAIELNPDYGDAYIDRGNVFLKLHRYEDAIQDFSMALRINPKSLQAIKGLEVAQNRLTNGAYMSR